jgi:hypothetical protein
MLSLPNTRFRLNGIIVLAAIAPLLYFVSIFAFSVNVPVGDDYTMLGFLNEFQAASGIENKLQLLFSFHNEHRIVITRAIMLILTKLTGAIDFRTLNLIGNFALLLTLLVIGRMLRLREDKLKCALLFLIVLQPQTLKLMFYPMAGVQAYFGLLFSFLYLSFSLKDSNWWYTTLLFYVLTVLTTGSGIFLVIIGIPLLLYKKCYTRAIIHLAVAFLVVLLYSPSSSNLPYLIEHPLTVVRFFLLLLGGVAQLPMLRSPYLQIGFSVALLGYFAYFIGEGFFRTSHRFDKKDLATLCCLLYLLMIIGLIAVGRTSLYERDLWGASLDGRYRIYSILFFAMCCIDFAGRLRERGKVAVKLSATMVTLTLLFNLVWFVPSIITMRIDSVRRVLAMKQWQGIRDISVLPIWATSPGDAEINLTTAIRTDVYRPQYLP